MDVIKSSNANKVVIETPARAAKREYHEKYEAIQQVMDEVYTDISLSDAEKKTRIAELEAQIVTLKAERDAKCQAAK